MKALIATLVLVVGSGSVAKAYEPGTTEIPSEVATSADSVARVGELRALQAAQILTLEAQVKWLEILKMSFEGSRQVTEAFDSQVAKTSTGTVATSVTVVVDAALARMWAKGAMPSVALIQEALVASRGELGFVKATTQKITASLKALGLQAPSARIMKTAALGAFFYVQYETFWVINMSRAQFDANMMAMDAKIAGLRLEKQQIADTFKPTGTTK